MASTDTLCKKLLNVKHTVVKSHDFYNDIRIPLPNRKPKPQDAA